MYSKILIATDGSATADRAVDRGLDLAESLGASPLLLTVSPPGRGKRVLDRTLGMQAHRKLQIGTLVEDGDPASVILDVAEEQGADLVVVGNKGMQGARRFFLSSIPNKIVHHARCAVLIVKTT